jgi:hypothetical protein
MKFNRLALIFICLLTIASSNNLTIIAIFRNEAPYLREWIEYHLMVGVDSFRLYDNGSEDHFIEVLEPYINSGIVKLIDWRKDVEFGKDPLYSYNFIPHQLSAYKDGIKHEANKAAWVALIDIDEFIVPMRDWKVTDCLNKQFKNADAIFVNWLNFGTSGVTIPKGENILPHLTRCSKRTHGRNWNGKSIIRPESCDHEKIYYAHHVPIFDGKKYVNGSVNSVLRKDGGDLDSDMRHHDKLLRINHYPLRDEDFYQNVRLKKNNYGYGGDELLPKHHKAFSLSKDKRIISVLNHYNRKK